MKNVIGLVAAILVFVGYIPYIRDILRDKTHPHVYSWFLWGLLTVVVFGIQISHHAGPGSFVTLAAGAMSLIVLFLSLKKGKRDIVFSDKVVLVLTIITIVIWLFAKRPLLAIILASLADLLAFVPTVRKSWNKPFTETLSLYQLNAVRFGLGAIALEQFTLITAIWPVMWAVCNALFALMLISRRKTLATARA
jgi:hypothetical protein